MYYVVRKGEPLYNHHAIFHANTTAKVYADTLKSTFGHEYDVVKVETVYTTQTLDAAMKEA